MLISVAAAGTLLRSSADMRLEMFYLSLFYVCASLQYCMADLNGKLLYKCQSPKVCTATRVGTHNLLD